MPSIRILMLLAIYHSINKIMLCKTFSPNLSKRKSYQSHKPHHRILSNLLRQAELNLTKRAGSTRLRSLNLKKRKSEANGATPEVAMLLQVETLHKVVNHQYQLEVVQKTVVVKSAHSPRIDRC